MGGASWDGWAAGSHEDSVVVQYEVIVSADWTHEFSGAEQQSASESHAFAFSFGFDSQHSAESE